MHFLILTQYYPPEIGAAQVRLAAFATQLVRAGHSVNVVTALPNYPEGRFMGDDRLRAARQEVIEGIPVTRMWLYPARGAGLPRLANYLSFALTGLIGALASRRPNVVFVESPPLVLAPMGWIAAKRFGAAFVLNVSDLWPDSIRELGIWKNRAMLRAASRLERWSYQRADAVTAVTEGIRTALISKGVPEQRALFLPNGVDVQTFLPVPVGAQHNKPMILYTGNHGYAQGLDIVLDAATCTPEVEYVLVGNGSERKRLEEEARARRVRNVVFRPSVPAERISELYGQASAGLVSLRDSKILYGARPAKLLAVMACGRPVLYAGAGEGAQLVRQAEAGLVVPPEDGVALAHAVRSIINDPEAAAQMGANGRRFVERELGWSTLVGGWLQQLEVALAGRHA